MYGLALYTLFFMKATGCQMVLKAVKKLTYGH